MVSIEVRQALNSQETPAPAPFSVIDRNVLISVNGCFFVNRNFHIKVWKPRKKVLVLV